MQARRNKLQALIGSDHSCTAILTVVFTCVRIYPTDMTKTRYFFKVIIWCDKSEW